MKDYLNTTERENLVRIVHLASDVERTIEGNLLSKQEIGNLKRGTSFVIKGVMSVLDRINSTSLKAFQRTAKGSKMTLDAYGDKEIILKRRKSEFDAAYEENEDYFKLVELIFDNSCKNCTKQGCNCDIYKEFEKQNIIEIDGTDKCTNCKYAFKEWLKNAKDS
ncbi:hypothetical protein FDA09_16825 [Clostridium botulinum]|uniref:DUF5651 domain-containing protein n=1 Tax=Clostridium botulinum TaxID=1491 RepID=UPI0007736924|nr:DUF5651 domain-containing protein [Clostridium botulinum]NFH81767.1 hypothetical protein [Clostridium botulinum]NFH85048.1 hypothetical protein [Clostridium botulinum]NFI13010.1 hypothetical protein [Clostridium botulinum]NFI16265.1 hypothetical protein [Clostridium botulinum]NFO86021.1 hypothetical protein [Clostridium botulinum]